MLASRFCDKRDIPIRSKLIELGFLDYVKAHPKRFFLDLSYSSKNGYGRNLSRWFNAILLLKLGIDSPSLVFIASVTQWQTAFAMVGRGRALLRRVPNF